MKAAVLYIGNDERFFDEIEMEFSSAYRGDLECTFEYMKKSTDDNYYSIFREIEGKSPDIIFIDYSTFIEGRLKLTYLLSQIDQFESTTLIGLFDYKTEQKNIKRAVRNGMKINLLKMGDDFRDIIYHTMMLWHPELALPPNISSMKKLGGIPSSIKEECYAVAYDENSIWVESMLKLSKGDYIDTKMNIPSNIIPSQICEVVENCDNDVVVYGKKYKTKINPIFIDRIKEPEHANKLGEAKIAEKKQKRLAQVDKAKKLYSQWLQGKIKAGRPKYSRVLIIDDALHMVDQAPTWVRDYPYEIRFQTHFGSWDSQLSYVKPQFIVFHYDEKENNEAEIQKIIDRIKNISDYNPFFVVFHGPFGDSKKLQERFEYPQLLSSPEDLSFDAVLSLLDRYEKKNRDVISGEFKDRLVTDPTKSLGRLTISQDITISNLTESYIEFECLQKLENYTVYQVEDPAKFFITIVPKDPKSPCGGNINCYKALVHSYYLDDKRELRQYISANR